MSKPTKFQYVSGQLRVGLGAVRRSGVLRSLFTGRPVDGKGEPIPWLTYPAIHQIGLLLKPTDVLVEFGCGCSSLWFSKRVAKVISIETDQTWANNVLEKARLTGRNNLDIRVCDRFDPVLFRSLLQNANVVLIDGAWRREVAELVQSMDLHQALIIIDNTDTSVFGGLPQIFEKSGRAVIRFQGLGPALLHEWETTLCLPKYG